MNWFSSSPTCEKFGYKTIKSITSSNVIMCSKTKSGLKASFEPIIRPLTGLIEESKLQNSTYPNNISSGGSSKVVKKMQTKMKRLQKKQQKTQKKMQKVAKQMQRYQKKEHTQKRH